MSVVNTLAVVCAADYDEIILESRSSELLLRNLKSDISKGPQMLFRFTWCTLLKLILSFVAGLLAWDAQVGAFSWRLLFQVSILHQSWCSDCTPQVCRINASMVQRSVSYDDPCTCLTPCVDTRTWKGGPTGIAMAIRGWPVGVTNSLNRNWIYTNESNLRVIPMLIYLFEHSSSPLSAYW